MAPVVASAVTSVENAGAGHPAAANAMCNPFVWSVGENRKAGPSQAKKLGEGNVKQILFDWQ